VATLPDSWLPLGPHTGQGRRSCGQLQWQCRIKVTTTQSHRPIAVPPSLRPLSFIQPGRACLRPSSRYPARPAPGQPHGGHPARAPDAPAVGMAARALGPPSGRSCPLAVSAPGSAGSAASCSPSAHPQRVRARRGPVMPRPPRPGSRCGRRSPGPRSAEAPGCAWSTPRRPGPAGRRPPATRRWPAAPGPAADPLYPRKRLPHECSSAPARKILRSSSAIVSQAGAPPAVRAGGMH
jgi:hypothetical protein